MPGNLAAAAVSPGAVLPNSLSTSFTESAQFPIRVQAAYHDLTVERSIVSDGVNTPVAFRTWQLSKRLTISQLAALYVFFATTAGGGWRPFYFYPRFSDYDASGASTTGRITAIFRGDWSVSYTLGRHNVPQLELVEIA